MLYVIRYAIHLVRYMLYPVRSCNMLFVIHFGRICCDNYEYEEKTATKLAEHSQNRYISQRFVKNFYKSLDYFSNSENIYSDNNLYGFKLAMVSGEHSQSENISTNLGNISKTSKISVLRMQTSKFRRYFFQNSVFWMIFSDNYEYKEKTAKNVTKRLQDRNFS